MPCADTFDVLPIGEFVKSYLRKSKVSIDPFARNKRWAAYTNDLNPDTSAECHMDAGSFLEMLCSKGVKADLVIFDPPYSLEQAKRSYESVGRQFLLEDTQTVGRWTKERDLIYQILEPDGIVLTFGWSSNGMGTGRGFVIEEILLVAHGGAHNDTICMAERKLSHQPVLFSQVSP
jgi:hypothetical protein